MFGSPIQGTTLADWMDDGIIFLAFQVQISLHFEEVLILTLMMNLWLQMQIKLVGYQ